MALRINLTLAIREVLAHLGHTIAIYKHKKTIQMKIHNLF